MAGADGDENGFDAFMGTEVRVGTIVEVDDFPEARRPAWKLIIDFGPDMGTRKSSAQITELYTKDDLRGCQVLALVNVSPRQIGPFMSECLTLGVPDEKGRVVLISPERGVPNGGKLY